MRARTPLVFVSGGKGGVGKTTVAANLAVCLAGRSENGGRRVLLVDLDLGLGDLGLVLRLAPERTVEDAVLGRAALADCRVRGPAGLDVIAASSGTPQMGRLETEQRARLIAELRALGAQYELVVADGAAGVGPEVLDFAAAADRVLVVTTPELVSVTDAYGLVKAVATRADERGLELATPEIVVNQAPSLEAAEACAQKLRGVCERFLARSPRWAGWLPAAPEIARSLSLQRPFALERGHEAGARSPGLALARGALERLAQRVGGAARAPALV